MQTARLVLMPALAGTAQSGGCSQPPPSTPARTAFAVALSNAKGPDSSAAPMYLGAKRRPSPAATQRRQATWPIESGCFTPFSTTANGAARTAFAVALSNAKGPDSIGAPMRPVASAVRGRPCPSVCVRGEVRLPPHTDPPERPKQH